MRRFFPHIGFVLALGAPWIGPAGATTVLPLNLERLTDGARNVVQGTVISTRTEAASAGSLPSVVTRIRVEQVFKGDPAKEIEFRQAGRLGPGRKIVLFADGMPGFSRGERVVVFLPPPSEKGFSSPVGLGQGVFRSLSPVSKPDPLLLNESRNSTLFENVRSSALLRAAGTPQFQSLKTGHGGPLRASQLKELIAVYGGRK